MSGLTARQSQALEIISSGIAEFGYPPSRREIAYKMGITSVNGVSDHIYALARKGYIELTSMKSRAIRVVRQQYATPGVCDCAESRALRTEVANLKARLARIGHELGAST